MDYQCVLLLGNTTYNIGQSRFPFPDNELFTDYVIDCWEKETGKVFGDYHTYIYDKTLYITQGLV